MPPAGAQINDPRRWFRVCACIHRPTSRTSRSVPPPWCAAAAPRASPLHGAAHGAAAAVALLVAPRQ
eukprot:829943-Prymnesium_polylepis.1